MVYDGEEMHYIEKDSAQEHSLIDSEHYLYKHSDLTKHNKSCGYAGDAGSSNHYDNDILNFDDFTKHNRVLRVLLKKVYYINKSTYKLFLV